MLKAAKPLRPSSVRVTIAVSYAFSANCHATIDVLSALKRVAASAWQPASQGFEMTEQ
jgi:hypothetical protein